MFIDIPVQARVSTLEMGRGRSRTDAYSASHG